MAHYHDEEWGVPVHDDRAWFEEFTLILEERAHAGGIKLGDDPKETHALPRRFSTDFHDALPRSRASGKPAR